MSGPYPHQVRTVTRPAKQLQPYPSRDAREAAWCMARAVFHRELSLDHPATDDAVWWVTTRTLMELKQ